MLRVLAVLAAVPCAPALRAARGYPALELPGIPLKGSSRPMPAMGFGTCCRKTSQGQALVNSTKIFLRLGGRHIDTAQKYSNHKDIKRAIQESGVPREELWITSKVNTITSNLTREGVVQAVDDSLRELNLAYLDLMLLHRPAVDPALRAEQWRGLIDAKVAGKVLNIGVSNYDVAMIKGLINATGVAPAVNQMGFNPANAHAKRKIVRFCVDNGIAVTAFGSVRDQTTKDKVSYFSKMHNATGAQLLLRWAMDQGVSVIPGATSEEHISENLRTPTFHLAPNEVQELEQR
uniref:NADP-dependent oxidoreductase domain-containing protein n=1 Tax=Alexandrium catenella TaxID=2925 RepID=A0A7S1SEI9_ALECA|mmetsp:Transcript_98108/g.260666  ORF Transcript_98108/g.260666 Transcript_98108/m.260666 type:complete len:291 (+) Transcript_98108:106-978(+)